jgi:hypothetical protein
MTCRTFIVGAIEYRWSNCEDISMRDAWLQIKCI